jgi:hypothetical protein
MAVVVIKHNSSTGCDKLEVYFEDGTTFRHDWHVLDPRALKNVLEKLGHSVGMVDSD